MLSNSHLLCCIYFGVSVVCASNGSISVEIVHMNVNEGSSKKIKLSQSKKSFKSFKISQSKKSFKIDLQENCFLKDGKPFRYIAGSMNYYRIPSIYWRDRMKKLLHTGLNALDTYVML